MIVQEKEGLKWLEFALLAEQPKLRHAVFLRQCGDVRERLAEIASLMEAEKVVKVKGCHGSRIAAVEEEAEAPEGCDGLTTSRAGAALLATHADCQAAILYDPIEHAASVVHCGWRGSVQNIYKEAVAFMQRRYGTRPENLLAGISPSLGPEKAEFIHYKEELPEAFFTYQKNPFYFDFWEIGRRQLEECGLLPGHIEVAGICTCSDSKNFFSYRRDKTAKRNGTCCNLL